MNSCVLHIARIYPSAMTTLVKVAVGVMAVCLGAFSQIDGGEEIMLTTKKVALTANRARVFQFLSDMRNYKRWYPGVSTCEPTDIAPVSIGKHYFLTYKYPLYGETTYSAMLAGYESPKYISFVIDDWVKSRVEISAEKHLNHLYPTTITWTLYTRNKSFLMKYVLSPLIGLTYTNEVRTALFNLRQVFTS